MKGARMQRLIPRPALTIAILLVWLILANSFAPGNWLMGALLGIVIPLITRRFWPEPPRMQRPLTILKLTVRVAIDIVLANWAVARRVLGPVHVLKPAFIEVPLDLRDPMVATILASIVTLTPGTVSIDVDLERWVLRFHALDAPDPEAVANDIKRQYELPLKEIFAC